MDISGQLTLGHIVSQGRRMLSSTSKKEEDSQATEACTAAGGIHEVESSDLEAM